MSTEQQIRPQTDKMRPQTNTTATERQIQRPQTNTTATDKYNDHRQTNLRRPQTDKTTTTTDR